MGADVSTLHESRLWSRETTAKSQPWHFHRGLRPIRSNPRALPDPSHASPMTVIRFVPETKVRASVVSTLALTSCVALLHPAARRPWACLGCGTPSTHRSSIALAGECASVVPRGSRVGQRGVSLWCSEGGARATASDAAPRRRETSTPEDAAAHLRRRRQKTTTTRSESLLVAEAPAPHQ